MGPLGGHFRRRRRVDETSTMNKLSSTPTRGLGWYKVHRERHCNGTEGRNDKLTRSFVPFITLPTASLRLSGLGFCFCEVVLKRTCSLPNPKSVSADRRVSNPCADHHVSVDRGSTTLSTALKNDTYLARRLTLSWEPAACACRLCRVTRVIESLT